jgi:L-threonylcarbamoyladenylate synthase
LDQKEQYRRAIDALRGGGVSAMPTDTVYGLIAVAADDGAVRRVYEMKGRPDDQPLPLFVGSIEQAELVGELTEPGRRLADRFWPGALTIVVPKKASYRTLASAGSDTIGLRVPNDAALREIAAQLGPLTATSANRSGAPECRSAAEVRAQLGDVIDVIVDAPVRADTRPSTVVDCTEPARVRIVRAGAVERDAIVEALAGVSVLI